MASKNGPLVILGAGLAGMSAALHAAKRGLSYLLLEKLPRPGGLVRSESLNGFTFDYTGHLLHTKQERTRELVLKELGLAKAFQPVIRDSWVYSKGRFTRAPFQANLHGLPGKVIEECLGGILRAHGHLRAAPPSQRRKRSALGPSLPRLRRERGYSSQTFEDWNLRVFGEGIYRHFMEPYNAKLWGIHPSRMSTEFMGRFVPKPSLTQVFEGALKDVGRPMGYNANFIYPKQGGIETLAKAFARKVEVRPSLASVSVDVRRREVRLSDGSLVPYRRLISTLPLPLLVAQLRDAPLRLRRAAARLRASGVLNVNFGVKGRDISSKQWVYVPESRFPFYRVGFYHNFSRSLAPPGGSSVYAEMSYQKGARPGHAGAVRRARQGLLDMGLLKPSDRIAATFVADIPHAYVVYDSHRADAVAEIQAYLRENSIISTGRWGSWEYSAMEDAIWEGADAVG